jgi:hypothetical protein
MSLLLVVPQNPSLNLDQNCSYHCNESEEAKLEEKKNIYILYIVNLAHPNLWHSKCKNSTKYINFFSWFS